MALTPPANLQPPTQEQPLAATGTFSEPWASHNQNVVDRLNALPAQLAALRKGVIDGSAAAAGDIGEFVTATFGPAALASNVAADLGSLPLTAGDWDVSGQVAFTISTGAALIQAWVSDVALTPLDPNRVVLISAGLFALGTRLVTGSQRFLKAAPATILLGTFATFGTGTVSAEGTIWARRRR